MVLVITHCNLKYMLSLKTLLRLFIEFWLSCSWKHISHACTLKFHSQVLYKVLHAQLAGRLSYIHVAWVLRMVDKHSFFQLFLILPASCGSLVSCERLMSHFSSFSYLDFQGHRGVFKSSHPPKEYQMQWQSTLMVL